MHVLSHKHTEGHAPLGWVIALWRVEKEADEIRRGGGGGGGRNRDATFYNQAMAAGIKRGQESVSWPLWWFSSTHCAGRSPKPSFNSPSPLSTSHAAQRSEIIRPFGTSASSVSSKLMRKIQGWRLERQSVRPTPVPAHPSDLYFVSSPSPEKSSFSALSAHSWMFQF